MGDTPILRADAMDDDLQLSHDDIVTAADVADDEEFHRHVAERTGACVVEGQRVTFKRCACGEAFDQSPYDKPDRSGDTVEPPPRKRMVPVVVAGVLHGYREEDS